jgi:hypothetical protein
MFFLSTTAADLATISFLASCRWKVFIGITILQTHKIFSINLWDISCKISDWFEHICLHFRTFEKNLFSLDWNVSLAVDGLMMFLPFFCIVRGGETVHIYVVSSSQGHILTESWLKWGVGGVLCNYISLFQGTGSGNLPPPPPPNLLSYVQLELNFSLVNKNNLYICTGPKM